MANTLIRPKAKSVLVFSMRRLG